MAVQVWTKLYVSNEQSFGIFDKHRVFENHSCQSVDAILQDVSVAKTIA